ncbi:PilZ domain-containing protein [Enterobacter hormaechei]
MEFLVEIKNKYEIIAIFRDHIKHEGRTVKVTEHSKEEITIRSISYDFIIIRDYVRRTRKRVLTCEMYCSLGLVTFELMKEKETEAEQYSDVICKIPKTITITQRRRSSRIYFDKELNYIATGRLKSGIMFEFIIKDLSDGGCALITDNRDIKSDAILKHVKLDFCEFGHFITTLKVRALTEKGNILILSCQFLFRNDSEKSKIESLIINMNLKKR